MKKLYEARRSNVSDERSRGERPDEVRSAGQQRDALTSPPPKTEEGYPAADDTYTPRQDDYIFGRERTAEEPRREGPGPRGTARTSRAQMFRRRRRLR